MRVGGKAACAVLTATAIAATVISGCGYGSPDEDGAAKFATALRERVTTDALMGHLAKLQAIADANDGNRSLGTSGYDASVDYVVGALRDKGFEVQTPEFEVRVPYADDPILTVDGMAIPAHPLAFTTGTPPHGVSGPLVAARIGDAAGCSAADYDGLPVVGAVVLVDRGGCRFDVKRAAAAERGAAAVIVADNVDEDDMVGTLGAQTNLELPVISVSKVDGARLRADSGQASISLNAGVRTKKSRNIIVQTRTGSTADVVMVGAHLDSVPWGPGIDDNGSSVAAVLETALQLGSTPDVNNAVRFSFWGSEEAGLMGSRSYVDLLDEGELKDIALYLNFDVLASPNPGYFTYGTGEGSAGVQRALSDYLKDAGKTPQHINIEGRSDDDSFNLAGVPTAGLFSGADGVMSVEQAQLWGGTAGEPFDPNYHKSTDTLAVLGRRAMEINGGGVAYAVGLYSESLSGRNGVPARADRLRHPGPCSASNQQQPASCGCGLAIRNGVPAWSCASTT